MKSRLIYLWLVAAVILGTALAGGTYGQPAQKKMGDVTVHFGAMTWKWGEGLYEFTGTAATGGKCTVEITSPEQATLTAPKLSLKLVKTESGRSVIQPLKTVGATHFTLVTKPDSKGIRRKMVGTASQGATYSEQNKTVVLTGNAKIDSVSLPEGPDSERVSFSAQALTVNLATRTVKADKGELKVNVSLEAGSAQQ